MAVKVALALVCGCLLVACEAASVVERDVSERAAEADEEETYYGVVIDAGSSGSRVRVYRWGRRADLNTLPDVAEIFSNKVKPGISALANDISGLTPHVGGLMDLARRTVPADQHAQTPMYLMATAGMRQLLEPSADSVMDEIRNILSNTTLNPFKYNPLNCRILAGEEEAVFAWVADNYLDGFFASNRDPKESTGILELGGASFQIAFVPHGQLLAEKFPVRIAGRTYPLYAQSFLGYGQNLAELWTRQTLAEDSPDATSIDNPCMISGDSATTQLGNRSVDFQGTGNPDACTELLQNLVYTAHPKHCHPRPCSIGTVYQPTIRPEQQFYAVSAFLHPVKLMDVQDDEGRFTVSALAEKAGEYCRKTLEEIREESGRTDDFLSTECVMAQYLGLMLSKGFGLEDSSRQVAAKGTINGQPAEWSLGAVLYEMERAAVNPCTIQPPKE